ncbi:MAG: hypothetical protein M1825_003617 [Sarcosagium campestre]|nr:MAG: hypothetical protein M1825_003617 [Sarcosagium campestre]
MASSMDDKSEICIPFILSQLKAHAQQNPSNKRPFFIGVNGVQGAGKTTLVSVLRRTLTSAPHSMPTAVLSIDDLYLPRAAQESLAASDPSNTLIQQRGVPGTHDVELGIKTFASLAHRQSTRIPSYDKSAFNGRGDRAPSDGWEEVNKTVADENDEEQSIDVVIFEGWCVGFRALAEEELDRAWRRAGIEKREESRLWRHEFKHLKFMNDALSSYDDLTKLFQTRSLIRSSTHFKYSQLDALIHIDAQDTLYVYAWREEQEAALRAAKGVGMSPDEVTEFVNAYYPAYELYTPILRNGALLRKGGSPERLKDRQLRLVVGRDRQVVAVERS